MADFHDPKKVLESLRNHLTQPEANVAFLFGAGTSCAVRVPVSPAEADGVADHAEPAMRSLIPNVIDLTALCEQQIRQLDPEGEPKRFGPAYDMIALEVKPETRPTNIEDILSCVRRKLQAVGPADTLAGLNVTELAELEKVIRSTIAAQVNPDPTSFPAKLPHEQFVRWIARMPRSHPVEIFTTNYDVLIETALEAERVPSFDGFVGCHRPFFVHESLTRPESAPGAAWARLWKIHGSINWRLETVKGRQRVIRADIDGDGEMILPSHHKYDESRKQPYSALMERLGKVLDRDDAILFVSGYSFGDEHINAIIFDALETKRRPHVVALQFDDVAPEMPLSDRATRHLNMMVLGPRYAHIGGKRLPWRLTEPRSASQLSDAFQIDPAEEGQQASGHGTFLLGDFAKWAAFLGALTGQS